MHERGGDSECSDLMGQSRRSRLIYGGLRDKNTSESIVMWFEVKAILNIKTSIYHSMRFSTGFVSSVKI